MADGKKDAVLGLGERLRSARKARALTLEQAAVSIRIESAVLRALEDERYEVLGAAVFVRGHLKAYAKLLGLSEETVLADYRAADPNADAIPRVSRELEKPLTTAPGPAAIGLAVIFAILAMLLLYALSGGKESGPQTAPTIDPTVSSVDAAAEPPPEPVPAPALTETTTPPAEVAQPAPATSFE